MIKLEFMEPLNEMAIINPKMCKQLTIQVEVEQRDEGEIPHVHVYHNKTRNPKECSYIRLDKCAYSEHHKDNIPLPTKLKRQFVSLMNQTCRGQFIYDNKDVPHPATGYQTAVQIWADTFEDGDLSKFELDDNGLIKQIDYSNLVFDL